MRMLKGVHVPHHKNTQGTRAVVLPVPKEVEIPMSMHIGAPARPVVKPGDTVHVGQLIAEAGGYVSAPIYASVSGTVRRIGEMLGSNGKKMQTIVIESDGLQTRWEGLCPPKIECFQDFMDAIRASGLVGLGGAGFPTIVKLSVKVVSSIKAVIINGAECEPFITSDSRNMLDDHAFMMEGARLIQKYLNPPRIIFAIEDNKPACIAKFRESIKSEKNMEVFPLKSMYPQGGEKVLIYHTIGEVVPEGKLPIDVGAVVLNCTTLGAIARYCMTGMPLVRKCVTVDGSAIREPKNVIVPIGMRMKDVFEACGGFCAEPKKILYGGPMMGIAVPDLEQPILKNTNAILAFNEKDARISEPTACIRCGRCISACPMELMPVEIETAHRLKKDDVLEKLKVNICMECGCCSFVCPAHRPLVQINKLAKARLANYKAARKAETEAAK